MKGRLGAVLLAVASLVWVSCAPAAAYPPAATNPPATLAAASCAPPKMGWNPTKANEGSKSMTVAFEQEPDEPVAMFTGSGYGLLIWQMYGVGPGKWDDKNNLVAYAATDVPSTSNGGVSADGLTLTWKLKPCIFWSDGQPITSRDFLFTWKAMMDPANAPVSRAGWTSITGIDTPDDQTVVIHFKSIYPAWPTLFDIGPTNLSGLLPEHIFTGKTSLEKDPEIHKPTWAGGPFAIKDWVAGDHMTLVRNPNYFGNRSKLDSINIKFVPSPESGLAALKTGDVDLMVNLAESDIEAVKALAPQGIRLRVDPTSDFEHLIFNLGINNSTVKDSTGKVIGNSDVAGFCPFQDVNVRKAIMLGIDRLSFIANYLKEDQKALIATLWPNSYWTNTSLQPYPYDPNQANQLLDAAGYKAGADGIRLGMCDGKPVRFSLSIETTTAQFRVDDVQAIQADLRKVGIEIKPNHIPGGTFFGSYSEGADMPKGKFDMAIFSSGYYPDPDPNGQWGCVNVPNKDQPAGLNLYHYCDATLDTLFAQGLGSSDPAVRKLVYDQIQQYMYDNVLMIPLYARAAVTAYASRLVLPSSLSLANAFWDAEDFDIRP